MVSPGHVVIEDDQSKHWSRKGGQLTHLRTRGSLIDPPLVLAQAPFVELNLVLLFTVKALSELSSAEIDNAKRKRQNGKGKGGREKGKHLTSP